MKSVHKKLNDLEKLKKQISDKLDKYDFNFNKDNKINDLSPINISEEKNNNKKDINIINKDYKQIMNKRLDDIMGKINDNIINQNYTNFYKFLSQASPYQKIKTKKIIQKTEESKESKENIQKEIIPISTSINNIELKKSEKISEKDLNEEKNSNKESLIKNEINIEKKSINKKNENIIINYNGTGKIDLEELNTKKESELLQKEQNIFLSNELIRLKCKLNDIKKDNEFLKSVINEKGMVKNTNVLEKFIGKFVERLSLNWNEIVNMIIDELLMEEAYQINEIDLKRINNEKNRRENININDKIKKGFSELFIDDEEIKGNNFNFNNTNMELILDNYEYIQKMLNNVKQTENDMKLKYNIK